MSNPRVVLTCRDETWYWLAVAADGSFASGRARSSTVAEVQATEFIGTGPFDGYITTPPSRYNGRV